ncbi:MarR family transcriptional regulator [Priestia aryabhattai]|uniref:MarR family transcriptional regulator n=1 Tax=Priestia aryabhattai TaxID=412384 RepID=UPI003D29D231
MLIFLLFQRFVTEQLVIPKGTVSVSIDGLVGPGLVERKQSKENRREVSTFKSNN